MDTIRLDFTVYDNGTRRLELELATYNDQRRTPWRREGQWSWETGQAVSLDEASCWWEALVDSLVRSTGSQLELPFQ